MIRARAFALGLFPAAVVGCTVLLGYDEYQCTSDVECAPKRGTCVIGRCVYVAPTDPIDAAAETSSDDSLACSSRTLPPIGGGTRGNAAIPFLLIPVEGSNFNADTAEPATIVGATIDVCSFSDVDCGTPIQSGAVPADGLLLSLPSSYALYVKMSKPSYLTAYVYFGGYLDEFTLSPSPTDPKRRRLLIPFIPAALASTLATLGGVSYDASLGLVVARQADCSTSWENAGLGKASIQSKNPGMSKIFYFQDGFPSFSATGTQESVGVAGLINVPPGLARIETALVTSGRPLSSVAVYIRGGAVTVLQLRPGSGE